MTCGNRQPHAGKSIEKLLEEGNQLAGWLLKKGMNLDSVVVQTLCARVRQSEHEKYALKLIANGLSLCDCETKEKRCSEIARQALLIYPTL